MENRFLNFIKHITRLPSEQESQFVSLLSTRSIAKGDAFIRAGQYPKTIGFVCKGLFRYYYTSEDGTEFTKGFFEEDTVLSSYSAMLENRGSYFTIQALEDSIIETISSEAFLRLFTQHPCWNEVLVAFLQKGYRIKEAREREFLLFNAEERYQAFLERYPGLDKRVKQHLVASYLGIAPESLSRIRKMRLS